MKRNILTSVGVFLFAAGAQAGIVSFIPVVPGSDVVHIDDLPVQVSYDAYITPETLGPLIDAINLLIGSNDVAFGNQDWAHGPGFGCHNVFCNVPSPGFYDYDIFVGAFSRNLDTSGPIGLQLGTLTITYPPPDVQPSPGNYFFGVNPFIDQGASSIGHGALIEPLIGSGVLHVVPEPNALILTAVGVVAILRRRRVGQCEESLR